MSTIVHTIPEFSDGVNSRPLRPWQRKLDNLLSEEPDRRTIIFVVDEVGNSGKSWFARWYQQKTGNTCQVSTGKISDMASMLPTSLKVFFLDTPRSGHSDLMNWVYHDPMYTVHAPMHIVVYTNEEPDRTKLAYHTYEVIYTSNPALVNQESFLEEIIPLPSFSEDSH